ncbi:ATP-binding cassette domain-containing protein [Cytophagaceae bacterium ABcell3]|nr:ATP-binding cassette domain-containing protein [Cytophagaceae bacterium ABcell3]
MNLKNIQYIHEFFLKFLEIDYNPLELAKTINLPKSAREGIDIHSYMGYLTETGGNIDLAYIKNEILLAKLEATILENHFPVLLFRKFSDRIEPVIVYNDQHNQVHQYVIKEGGEIEDTKLSSLHDLLDTIYTYEVKPGLTETIFLTVVKNESMYTPDSDDAKPQPMSPVKRLWLVLLSEKKSIYYLYVYAILAGLISLSLPLGIQAIIGFITSGQVSTSIVVLISFVSIGVLLNGGLQIMQLSLTEHIQQRLFLKTAFDFSYRLPKLKQEAMLKYNATELLNRFFDVVTVQKGVAKMLIDLTATAVTIVFGLTLLAFYHVSFIMIGVLLMVVLYFLIKSIAPKALKTSIYESKNKYKVANWLEEMARTSKTFKLAGYSNLPLEKTDYNVSNYLYYRKNHFKHLVSHYKSFVGFKTLFTAGLLIVGCILVVNEEINIGQFVASEIIIILIIYSIEKLISTMEVIYDVLASVGKLGDVTDVPIEKMKGIYVKDIVEENEGLKVNFRNVSYRYPETSTKAISNINLTVNPSEHICLAGFGGAGRSTLVNVMLGFYGSFQGTIEYNRVSLRDLNKNSLLNQIGDNIHYENIFESTIEENITMGRKDIPIKDLFWAIEHAGLAEYINDLPDGLKTQIIFGHRHLPTTIAKKIILARSIVKRPKLLIIDEMMLNMDIKEKIRILKFLFDPSHHWTIIILSNDPGIMKMCDKVTVMKQGQIVQEGHYEVIKNDENIVELTTSLLTAEQ